MQLAKPQKFFGPKSFLACLLLIDLLLIFAIDMYLPTLPSMQKSFGVTVSYLNMTLFLFLLVSAISVIFMGPVSNRIGRKPSLILCCVFFFIGSAGCTLSPSIEVLIFFRMIEAWGMGGVIALETAIIKDAYSGESMNTAMTIFQSLAIIGPAIAPFLGSFMVNFFDWRAVFAFLTGAGLLSIVLSCLISETSSSLNKRQSLFAAMISDSKTLLKKKSFLSLCAILGLAGIPYFAILAVISYVCLDFFAVSYLEYCIVYLVICVVSIIAPYVYLKANKALSAHAILKGCFILFGISGVSLFFFGTVSYVLMTLSLIPYLLAEGIIRPLSFVELLDQPDHLTGTASSLSNFFYSFVTSFATVFATFEFWPNYLLGICVIIFACLIISLGFFAWRKTANGKEEAI
ncbi:MAG: MFS transporter [Anaerotardibacter sp.]